MPFLFTRVHAKILLILSIGMLIGNLITLVLPLTGLASFILGCFSRFLYGLFQTTLLTYVIAWIDSTFKIQNMIA